MNAQSIHVLLVEDNPGDARLLEEYLREPTRVRFDLSRVERLDACLERLEEDAPDVVLLDLGLPDSQGLETFAQVHDRAPEVPIVVMTGLDDSEAALAAVQAGAQDYLVKDQASPGLLARALQYAIQRKGIEAATHRHAENMAVVAELGRTLATAHTPESLFELLAGGVRRLLPDIATLFISEYDAERRMIRAAYGLQDDEPVDVAGLPEYPLAPEGSGTQSQVIHSRQALIIDDGLKKVLDPKKRVVVGSQERETRSALFVPMLAHDQVLGVIQVQSYTPGRFQEQDRELLALVGNTAAVTLQNTRLLGAVREELAERLRAETALRESESKYRRLVENLNEGIWHIDRDARTTFVNPRMAEMLGYTVEEMLDVHIFDFMEAGDRELAGEMLERRAQGLQEQHEFRFRHKDGGHVHVSMATGPLLDENGEYVGAIAGVQDVTERVRALEALRESERRYRELFQGSRDGFVMVDPYGAIVDANQAYCEMLGYSLEELRALEDFYAVTPERWHAWEREEIWERRLLGEGYTGLYEKEYQRKDGTVFPVELQSYAVRASGGGLLYCWGLARDISARVQAEQDLRRSEQRYRLMAENAIDVIWQMDLRLRFTYVTPSIYEVTGYTPEEWIGTRLFEHASRAEFWKMARVALRAVKDYRRFKHAVIEANMLRKDGSEFPVEIIGRLLLDEQGRPVGLQGATRDISQRVQARDELQASELKFRTLVEQLPAVVYINPAGDPSHTTYVSPQIEALLGYTQEQWLGDPGLWSKRLHPEDRELVLSLAEHIRSTGEPLDTEYRLLARDGREVWIRDRVAPLRDGSGAVIAWQGLMLDVTARVQAERARQESEAHYRALFMNVPDGVYRTSADGNILAANPALAHMLGYGSPDELLKMSVYDFYLAREQRDDFKHSVERQGEVANYELRLRRKDGSTIDVLENARAVYDAEGRIQYYEGTLTEITALKRAQESLAQHAEELERLNRATTSLLTAAPQDIEDLAGNIARTVAEVFEHTNCSLFYTPDSSEELHRIAVAGPYAPHVAGKSLSTKGAGLVPKAVRTGRVINARDVGAEPDYVRNWAQARSELAIPLKLGDRVVGALDVQSAKPDAFSPDDERLLCVYAERAVEALENARLAEQTERHLQRILSLRAVDLAISSSFDLNIVLDTLLEQLAAQLRIDAACVLLYDRHQHVLTFSRGRGFRTQALKYTSLKPGEGHAGRALLENKTVHVADLTQAPEGLAKSELFPQEGFVSYWGVPLVAKGTVKGVLEVFRRQALTPDQEWIDFLEVLAGQAAIAIDNAELYSSLQRANAEIMLAYDNTLEGWANALELRDKETEGHARRVTEWTLRLAEALGVKGSDLLHIRRGALLHDIGKMGVPDEILLKPGPLTEAEWEIMRRHPVFAYELLIPISYLRPALDIPYCHHEKWDGSGYPRGLKGEEIPLAARIFAVIDVWDALRSDRPYREAWPREKALAYIREQAGAHFDPRVVDAFLTLKLDE